MRSKYGEWTVSSLLFEMFTALNLKPRLEDAEVPPPEQAKMELFADQVILLELKRREAPQTHQMACATTTFDVYKLSHTVRGNVLLMCMAIHIKRLAPLMCISSLTPCAATYV